MFYNIGHWCKCYSTFPGIIYATGNVFPYDFDLGYSDYDVIMSKKFYKIGHRSQCNEFFGAIYGTGSVYHYDFICGYTDIKSQ
jgi:hypothetical protein